MVDRTRHPHSNGTDAESDRNHRARGYRVGGAGANSARSAVAVVVTKTERDLAAWQGGGMGER